MASCLGNQGDCGIVLYHNSRVGRYCISCRMCVIGLEWIENHRSVSIVGCPQAGRDEPMSRAGTTLHGVGARGGLRRR